VDFGFETQPTQKHTTEPLRIIAEQVNLVECFLIQERFDRTILLADFAIDFQFDEYPTLLVWLGVTSHSQQVIVADP
jgi:hypothetical protein